MCVNAVKILLFKQGYPCELLALTVAGIPSMHICLDFIPELIAQPELEKQVLCVVAAYVLFSVWSLDEQAHIISEKCQLMKVMVVLLCLVMIALINLQKYTSFKTGGMCLWRVCIL